MTSKKTTELRATSHGTYLRATYGLDKSGTFSLSAEEYRSKRASERTMVACGQLVDEVRATFPELAHLLCWHLCDARGPMHYLANGLFWHDAFHGIGQFQKAEDAARAPSALASTVVLGSLPDDVTIDALLAMSRDDAEAYLQARLPHLCEAFAVAMVSMD